MKLADRIFYMLRNSLPSPLSIAILLTIVVFGVTCFTVTPVPNETVLSTVFNLWEQGVWSTGGLVFLVQMMLMLILGHVLALTNLANQLINRLVGVTNNPQLMVWLVCFATLLVSWFNWGLGLIFGAIFCRKIGEYAQLHKIKINYALIGAAGYSGLMFWHGGLSGSALVKVAEQGHLQSLAADKWSGLPSSIGFNETVFSGANLGVSLIILLVVPFLLMRFGKSNQAIPSGLLVVRNKLKHEQTQFLAEKLDVANWFGFLIGGGVLLGIVFQFFSSGKGWAFVTPNSINLTLLGLALLLHGSVKKFSTALDQAITDGAGILIQFPLYFGIMGLMSGGNLIEYIANFFVGFSSTESFPVWAFISAGFVNLFVPSGGGQWMVQGPIIIDACMQLGVPLKKGIMALAYGDQITNMLQPFWALPLLGITKLKAQEILPYTLLILLVGSVIYLLGLTLLY